eukprot:741804_1
MKTFIPPIFTFIYLICCLSNGDKLYADTGQQKNDIILLPNGMVNSISTNYKSTDKICKTITKELSFINLLKEIYDKNEVVSEEEDKNDEAKEEEQIFCDGQTCDQCSAIYDGVSLDPCRIEYVSLFCNGKDYPNSCMTEENGVDKLTEIPQTCNRIDPMGCDKFYVQKDGFQDNGCTKRKCDGGELEKTSITESICDSGLRTDLYNYGISFKIKTIVVFSDYQALQDKLNDQTIVHELYDASDPTTNDPSTQPTRSPILPTTSPISVLNNGCDLFSTKNKLTRPGGDKIRIDKSIIYVDDYSNVSLRGDINDDGLGSLSAECIKTNIISNWSEPSTCYTKMNTIVESFTALKGSSSNKIIASDPDGFQDDVNGCTKRKCDGGELEKASSTESICDSGLNNKSKTECDYNGLLDFDNQFIEAVSNESCCIDDDNINYKYIGHDKYDKEREFFRFDINKYIREEQIFCNGQRYANPCLTESKSDKCFMDT